jgi:hypothetical protein
LFILGKDANALFVPDVESLITELSQLQRKKEEEKGNLIHLCTKPLRYENLGALLAGV